MSLSEDAVAWPAVQTFGIDLVPGFWAVRYQRWPASASADVSHRSLRRSGSGQLDRTAADFCPAAETAQPRDVFRGENSVGGPRRAAPIRAWGDAEVRAERPPERR